MPAPRGVDNLAAFNIKGPAFLKASGRSNSIPTSLSRIDLGNDSPSSRFLLMVSYAKYPAPGKDPAALKGYLPMFPNAFNIGTPAAFCTATALGTVKPTPVVIGF